jgi:hypothetical protein
MAFITSKDLGSRNNIAHVKDLKTSVVFMREDVVRGNATFNFYSF